jgi:hypothetical protein
MRLTLPKRIWIPIVVAILLVPTVLNAVADNTSYVTFRVPATQREAVLKARAALAERLGIIASGLIGGLTIFTFTRYKRGAVPRARSFLIITSLTCALASAMCGVMLYVAVLWMMDHPATTDQPRIAFHTAGQFWLLVLAAIFAGSFVAAELFAGDD